MNPPSLRPVVHATKTEAASAALDRLARELGPGRRLPRFNDLCKTLCVSRVTLDRALARLEQQGVLVRRHGRGIFTTEQLGQRTIGVVIGSDPFEAGRSPAARLVLDRLYAGAEQHQLRLRTYLDLPNRPDRAQLRQSLQAEVETGQVHGLILHSASGATQRAWLTELGVPLVYSGRETTSGWRVGMDYDWLIDTGVAELARQGCRRAGLFTHVERRLVKRFGNQRRRRFRAALQHHGLDEDTAWSHMPCRDVEEWTRPGAPGMEQIGYEGARDRLADDATPAPDGLLITDDMMARGALTALSRAGLRPGHDVHIVTHSNRGTATLIGYEDELTRLEVDLDALADCLLHTLETLLDGSRPTESPIRLRPTLIRPRHQSA
ncbi:MAG: substrate-binding domain-containing protein [Phycisphaeraceae bacterium]